MADGPLPAQEEQARQGGRGLPGPGWRQPEDVRSSGSASAAHPGEWVGAAGLAQGQDGGHRRRVQGEEHPQS
eukprot:7878592-Lingulodinium_polyedra.AAC.1